MELFKIICVTCQAKLSVRNESLIGQIVACPRCDSMVEVTPPTASAPVAPQPVPTTEEVPENAPVVPQETTALSHDAEILQASASVAKYQLITWSLASFFVGATLVGAVLLTRSNSNNEATAIVPKKPETTITELPTTSVTVAENPPNIETPAAIVPAAEVPTPTIEESIATQPVTNTVETPAPAPPADEPSQTSPRVARRFDPLDFDPENLTLATVDQLTAKVEPLEIDSADETAKLPKEIPSTVPLVRRGPDGGKDTSVRDAEKQLALLVPKVTVEQLSLVDFLRLISQMSGVPVSVAHEQLLMAGITPDKKVSLDTKEISLGMMLDRVLKPLRLKYGTRGAQVVVTRQEASKRLEVNYPIADLVGSETSLEQLATWVEQLVAPTTWQAAGGKGRLETTDGKLRIEQTQQVQYQVLILLERLRLTRNLPPSNRYPVKRLAGTPANVLLQKQLAKSATFTFSQYTPIEEVFVHWQTELGVPLLIDWPALAEAEVWPATTIACAMIDQPWDTALDKILEPLGLGWRATTGGAIEITSAEKVRSELQLELYPLRREFEGEATSLRALAKQHAGGGGVILYDPVGKVLLVLESAAMQRGIFQRLKQKQWLLGE